MAKGIYLGIDSLSRKVKKMYIGIEGVARKVKKGYIGINGIARLFFAGGGTPVWHSTMQFDLPAPVRAGAENQKYALFPAGSDSDTVVLAVEKDLTYSKISVDAQYRNPNPQTAGTGGGNFGEYAIFGKESGGTNISNKVTDVFFDNQLTKTESTINVTAMIAKTTVFAGAVVNDAYSVMLRTATRSHGAVRYAWDKDRTGTYLSYVTSDETQYSCTGVSTQKHAFIGFGAGLNRQRMKAWDEDLTEINVPLTQLNNSSSHLAGAQSGEYAIFGGGLDRYSSIRKNVVCTIDEDLTESSLAPLQAARDSALGLTFSEGYFGFGGGRGDTGKLTNVEMYNPDLTKGNILEATTDSFFAGAKTGSYMLCAPQNEPNFQVFEQ